MRCKRDVAYCGILNRYTTRTMSNGISLTSEDWTLPNHLLNKSHGKRVMSNMALEHPPRMIVWMAKINGGSGLCHRCFILITEGEWISFKTWNNWSNQTSSFIFVSICFKTGSSPLACLCVCINWRIQHGRSFSLGDSHIESNSSTNVTEDFLGYPLVI